MASSNLNCICQRCGANFTRHPAQIKNGAGKFCSKKCQRGTLTERFWEKVDKTPGHGPKGDCWEWTARRDKDGYGGIKCHGHFMHANRVSWALTNGPIPGALFVLHRCDNPPCVRPDHLFLGTLQDNAKDMVMKGRGAKGTKNGRYTKPERSARGESVNTAVLTTANVREILSALKSGKGLTELGRQYGVCKQAIYGIREGITWKHIERG